MMRSENFIPSFLFYSLFESGSESDSHILRIMTNYLVHPRTWVRKVIYSEILFNLRERIDLGHIGDDGGCEILLPKWITSSKFVHAVAQYGFDDSVPEINNISQEIIELMLNNSLMVSPQILLSPLQAVCHIKEGELLNLCTNVCSERLDRISWLLFWWKGLLHRSEWYVRGCRLTPRMKLYLYFSLPPILKDAEESIQGTLFSNGIIFPN